MSGVIKSLYAIVKLEALPMFHFKHDYSFIWVFEAKICFIMCSWISYILKKFSEYFFMQK